MTQIGELNLHQMDVTGVGVVETPAVSPAMVANPAHSTPPALSSGAGTTNDAPLVAAIDQLNSALKICGKDGHTPIPRNDGSYAVFGVPHSAISGNRLVIPGMIVPDDALAILQTAINAVMLEGYAVKRTEAFRAVWFAVRGLAWKGGRLVANV